ncbi:MAG: amidohydrolase, partial [Chitinophagaceae bacterium]|nr:amidohydrolase [Chitinophagaceae bacterium]
MARIFIVVALAFVFINVAAQKEQAALKLKTDAAADKIEAKCISWRRDFHQHPELGNHETRTAGIIASHLRSLGIEVKEGIAKTGVVGILKGGKPGPVIGLRADMDGLPITERNDLPFISKEKANYNGQEVGVMHACGHDSHIAILMSVAEILSGIKKDIKGTIVFVFQPSEEGPPPGEEGGASLMVKEAVMDNPKIDVMFGLHIESATEVGQIQYKPGAFMASADEFTIKVNGKGSHGSQPWRSIDPIVISAQIINGLQTVVSRQSDITKAPVIISVGKISAGVRFNIIPEESVMSGTIRTLDNEMRPQVLEKIRTMVTNIAEANGATAETSFNQKTLVTYNDPLLVKKILPSLETAAGKENVIERQWVTTAEDFSYYGTKAPTFFFYL